MKKTVDVQVTYVYKDEKKLINYERKGLLEYGFNSSQNMVYFIEKSKSDNPLIVKEHIFWIPTRDILEMEIDFSTEFDTKKEKLEFLKSKNQ